MQFVDFKYLLSTASQDVTTRKDAAVSVKNRLRVSKECILESSERLGGKHVFNTPSEAKR